MEKRLIDANNAISVLKILSDKCCDDNVFEQAISVLESAPTIDATEVTHCKDCKHGSPNGQYGCTVYHYKRYETHDMKPDDFCSFAERRTDERD